MTRCIVALFLIIGALPAPAQSLTGIPAVDSASAARAAYGRAIRATDSVVARREMERAASAWPTQQAYVWANAVLAARAGDTASTVAALGRFADLGLGRDLGASKDLAFISRTQAYSGLVTQHALNRAPLPRSRVVRTVGDSTLWPEAADHDPATGAFYMGSVRHGTIVRIDSSGTATELWPRDSLHLGAVMGVRVDLTRRALWATTSGIPQYGAFQPGDTALASVLEIGLDDGRIRRQWDLPVVPRGHTLGDLAVAPNGDVYITDSNHPMLYRLHAAGDTIAATTNPLFHSLQGVAPTPDGKALYLADYAHGLIRMDLATGTVTRLADAPRSTSLGCDGIVWYRGSLIAIQNGFSPARVVRFHLDASGFAIERAEVIDRNTAIADEPTIGTIVGDEFVYVSNSQWEKHDDAGRLKAGARLVSPILLGVILK